MIVIVLLTALVLHSQAQLFRCCSIVFCFCLVYMNFSVFYAIFSLSLNLLFTPFPFYYSPLPSAERVWCHIWCGMSVLRRGIVKQHKLKLTCFLIFTVPSWSHKGESWSSDQHQQQTPTERSCKRCTGICCTPSQNRRGKFGTQVNNEVCCHWLTFMVLNFWKFT